MKISVTGFKRWHAVRVGIAYVVVAWLVLQLVNNIVEPLRLPDWTATLVVVLLAIGFPVALVLAWAFGQSSRDVKPVDVNAAVSLPRATTVQGLQAPAAASTTPSIAVMPFVNMSSDAEQEYFSDGLSEELLNKLARLKGLQVAGRTSSFHFKGRNENLRVIGETLGVAHILEGSVRKSGDRVRITAQLIKSSDGYHLWSHTYDRKLDDIFAIQDEIAEAVAAALSVALGVGDLGCIEGGTRNVDAYDAFLYGRTYFAGAYSHDMVRSRIASLERAVKLDPAYALAWATLARGYSDTIMIESAGIVAESNKKTDRALARALELAPGAAEVLSESARAAASRGDWAMADQTYRKALELHGNASLAMDYGAFLLTAGKARQSIQYLAEARRIEPLKPEVSYYLSVAYDAVGKTADAIAEAERGDNIGEPQSRSRGTALMVALAMDDRNAIKRYLDMIIEVDEINRPVHGAMPALIDDRPAALAELHRMFADPAFGNPFNRFVIAVWAAYLGDADLALAEWKVFNSLGGHVTTWALNVWQPVFRDMRRLPGFKAVVKDLGLVDYWRATGNWGDFCHPVGQDDFECQ